MPTTLPLLLLMGTWLFALGAVVGSFLNVCIYRIPWQKSVIWPASHCPRCWSAIAARDNVPIFGWLALGGKCRSCRNPISVRYPLIEALVGLLFVAIFIVDVIHGRRVWQGELPTWLFTTWLFHAILIALLVASTFIDYDLYIIPDAITLTGMIAGVALGTVYPWIRPEPSTALTAWGGFWTGVAGLLIGGGLTGTVRLLGSLAVGREAMGFGDVTLMAMIGAFLGWQAAVLTFFIAPFFGLAHALGKLAKYIVKRLSGAKSSSADREIPFGPYLSMAAVALVLSWPWLWDGWAKDLFHTLLVLFLWVTMGVEG
ncbi:leader peptidase (prepilin peptidase) / N-methyltransferase [Singulisphaera sp. GP187]|uniref:prepilin peptidase n=1 Tax=Singulisphaera sp. GP187 TaxID=1882752 RepID=UPI000925D98E|nr:A24 family peptidase [Singulisphaera sp. GP187]SIO61014.1 leader peptidase (prepilin peptidase) / N-methyltransferase [Singulisphaera sp. GP187]